MNLKYNSLNQSSFNKITKKMLLENYQHYILDKDCFYNLSKSKIIKRNNSPKNSKSYSKNTKSVSSLKIETKKKCKISLLGNFNNKNNQKKSSKNNNSSNNITLYSSNEKINPIPEYKKTFKKNILYRNNKSSADILAIKPLVNINTMTNSSLNKNKKLIKEQPRNTSINYNYRSFENSINSNKHINSNIDLLGISSQIETSVKQNKIKKKLNIKINTGSTPNLLSKNKRPKIKDKEKSHKIFKNRGFFNKNLYNTNNTNNNYNYKPIIKSNNNNKSKNITKLNKPLDMSLEYLNVNKNINLNNKGNNNKNILNNIDLKKKLSTIIQSDTFNRSKNEESKISNITSSKNSEKTIKDSHLDLNKLFDDKIINEALNNNNNNNIYNIISNNMSLNLNNKNKENNINNNNININYQETININEENSENNNFINNINKKKELFPHNNKNGKPITLFNIDSNIKNKDSNYNNMINSNMNFEKRKEINKNINNYSKKNSINYSYNNNINYNVTEEENKNSSIKTNNNNNIDNKYYLLNQMNELIKKDEQELQTSQFKNKAQSQTNSEKNNIASKFEKQSIYNISPRFSSIEKSLINHNSLKNKSYIFIEDIEQKNKNIPMLNINKLLSLEDISIYKLISFSYDNYTSIISSNKLLKNKINISFKNIFQPIISDFQNKYSSFLKVLSFSFHNKNFINNHDKNNLLNLEIKCQIITKEIKKSYEIGCNYISNGKKYDYMWKFDVQKKSDIKLWLCTELEEINNLYKKYSYTSQVSSFCYQDEIILIFNIFSKGNNINLNSIEWMEPIISNAILGVYENSKFISSFKYDQLRACEVETQILFWKNITPNIDGGIVDNFKKIYEKNFEIKNIYFDISKFYFFKFEMIAKNIGIIKQNKFFSFDINIIEYKSHLTNEIQCIYLMNSNYFNKSMDIRLGTRVTFYIIDMRK